MIVVNVEKEANAETGVQDQEAAKAIPACSLTSDLLTTSQEVTFYLLYVTMVKSAEKALVKSTLKVFTLSLKWKMQVWILYSTTSRTSNLTTAVLGLKNLATLLKAEVAAVVVHVALAAVAATEEASAVVAAVVVTAEVEDVKVEMAAVVSGISLEEAVMIKVEAEDVKADSAVEAIENADLNFKFLINKKAPEIPGLFWLVGLGYCG